MTAADIAWVPAAQLGLSGWGAASLMTMHASVDDPDYMSERTVREWCAQVRPIIFEDEEETRRLFATEEFFFERVDFQITSELQDFYEVEVHFYTDIGTFIGTRMERALALFKQNFSVTQLVAENGLKGTHNVRGCIIRLHEMHERRDACRVDGRFVERVTQAPVHHVVLCLRLRMLKKQYHQDLFQHV